jgi:hypothetical protein
MVGWLVQSQERDKDSRAWSQTCLLLPGTVWKLAPGWHWVKAGGTAVSSVSGATFGMREGADCSPLHTRCTVTHTPNLHD